eukprot:COSAG01_NODE_29385_length_639_cov_0.853704_1_plen_74_part_10
MSLRGAASQHRRQLLLLEGEISPGCEQIRACACHRTQHAGAALVAGGGGAPAAILARLIATCCIDVAGPLLELR